jgi:hypothetical protein
MVTRDWLDLAVLERRKHNYLAEVLALSQQMGEALDRSDQVSLNMLVAMRQEPILQLQELKSVIDACREELPQEDQEQIIRLLEEKNPSGQAERTFLDQAAAARRLLEQVLDLDRRVNQRVAAGGSFYKN